jgi:hypothetical protein
MSVWRTLKAEDMKPYKINIVYAMQPSDPIQQLQFVNVMLQKINTDTTFFDKMLWIDEAGFNLYVTGNKQNTIYLNIVNPYFFIERRMRSLQVNVWAGGWSGGIMGPFMFDGTVNARSHIKILQNEILPAIRAIQNNQNLWFMHDGAAPHFAHTVINYLNQEFPGL